MGLMIKIERREFLRLCLLGGTLVPGLAGEACRPSPLLQPSATPEQTLDLVEQMHKVHQEVKRLALTLPEDSLVRKVYLGNVAEVNPIFQSPTEVGFMYPTTAYAMTYFGVPKYTPEYRFRYLLTRNNSVANYAILQKMAVSIIFSQEWLTTTSYEVKMLALEKEATQLSLWKPFSRIALNTYLAFGKVEKIDPTVTDQEIADTLTRSLLIEDPNVNKLYDYAGYLAVLNKVGQLLAQGNQQIINDLDISTLNKVYNLAKRKGIQFENLEFASTDFLRTAFDPNGAWAKMILDPSIPAPHPPD